MEKIVIALALAAAGIYLVRALVCFLKSLNNGKASCPSCACSRKTSEKK